MTVFHMTFGTKYKTEPHPTLPREVADPDGYLAIDAPDFETAYRIALGLTLVDNGGVPTAAYSHLGEAPEPGTPDAERHDQYFPRGATARVTFQLAKTAPHGCGMCNGPLVYDGVDFLGFDNWHCTRCSWGHTSRDCCQPEVAS